MNTLIYHMKFRRFIVVIALFLMGSAGWTLWAVQSHFQLVEIADIAMEEMRAITNIRIALNRQMKEFLDFWKSNEKQDLDQYQQYQNQIFKELDKWKYAAERSTWLQTPGEQEELGGIIILGDQYRSVATELMLILEKSGEGKGGKRWELIQEPLGLLSELVGGMQQRIAREMEEAERAYNQLSTHPIHLLFPQRDLRRKILQAQAVLAFVQETDEMGTLFINIINSLKRVSLAREQSLSQITFMESKASRQESVTRWLDLLVSQLDREIYQDKNMGYLMRKNTRILEIMTHLYHQAFSQLDMKNIEATIDTDDNRIEGILDAYLLPSLMEISQVGEKQFLSLNQDIKRNLTEIQSLALLLLVGSLPTLLVGFRKNIRVTPESHT